MVYFLNVIDLQRTKFQLIKLLELNLTSQIQFKLIQ